MPKFNGKLMRRRNLILSLGLILVLVAAACGDDEEEAPTPTPTPTPEEAANNPPTADFTFTPDAVPRGDNFQTVVTFTATASDPDGDPLTFQWTFKSGRPSTDTGDVVTSSFPGVAPYTVTLTVSDGRGGEVTVTKTVPLGEPTPTPVPEEVMEEVAILETAEHPELGTILICATTGRTLYLFTVDERNKSNCTGECAGFWPPLLTTGNPVAGEGVNSDLLGIIIRDDGSTQVTYNGWPLYYFSQDESPGDANGQYGEWFVVSTYGGPIQTNASVQTAEHPELGTMLTDASGRSLYLFFNDELNQSNCSGMCPNFWPPLLTTGDPIAGEGVDPDLLGSITRDDGYTQVIYNGRPLYYFSGDEKPGDANGQGAGDKWFTVSSQGQPVQPTVMADVVVALNDLIGSGQFGVATLTATANKTLVVIDVTPGAPENDPQPIHIHSGSCGPGLGGVDYPLTDVVGGVSVTLVDATLESLRGGNNAINIHESFPTIGTYTSCGNIPTEAESVSITLEELNGSGQSGTATLVAQGDQTLVSLAVTPGLPENEPQPIHIHSGSCGPGLGGVDYPLTDIVDGESVTVVDASLESLMGGNNAINIHESFPEIGTYTSCGNIPVQSGSTNTSSTGDDNGGGGYSY